MTAYQTLLVEHNLPLVHYYITKAHITPKPWDSMEDIVADGNAGLVRAARLYDPAKGAFSTFAIRWIRLAVIKGLESRSPLRYDQARALSLGHSLADTLHSVRGQYPSTTEIDSLVPGYARASLHARAFNVISLDDHDQTGKAIAESIPDDGPDPASLVTDRVYLQSLISRANLTRRHKALLYQHYFEGIPLSALAPIHGVSRSRIWQLHEDALALLRKAAIQPCSRRQATLTTSSETSVANA